MHGMDQVIDKQDIASENNVKQGNIMKPSVFENPNLPVSFLLRNNITLTVKKWNMLLHKWLIISKKIKKPFHFNDLFFLQSRLFFNKLVKKTIKNTF
jgi:hypothetical protein